MTFKVGNIVSHSGGTGWGSGKVLEVSSGSVRIQFSDGISRKIASSHYTTLEPAAPGTYLPPAEALAVAKAPRAPRVLKKKKS